MVPPVRNPLLLKSAAQLAEEIRNKKVTSIDVVSAYIDRIKEVNPIINAVCDNNFEKAAQAAKEVDEKIAVASQDEIDQIAREKPLFGVPFTCKDHFNVPDTYRTWGAWSKKDAMSTDLEEAVKKIFDAGAILLAKTTVPEMCMWIESQNAIHGFTNNPYDSRRSAGGSSGGEGAIVAAAGSLIGIGSDIAGSIRVPSVLNGIYGLKPSPGLSPVPSFEPHNDGIDDLCVSGPLCRYLEDIELVLKIYSVGKPEAVVRPADAFDIKSVLVSKGVEAPLMPRVKPEMQAAAEKVAQFLCDSLRLPSYGSIDFAPVAHDYINLFVANFDRDPNAPTMRQLLEVPDGAHNPLTEIPKYFLGLSRHSFATLVQYPYMNRKYSSEDYANYHKQMFDLRARFDSLLSTHSLVVMPGWPNVAGYHNLETATINFGYTGIINILGLPSLVCPIGLNKDGLPLAVQLVGPRGSDYRLVEVAKKIDQEFGGWTQPGTEKNKQE